MLRFDIHRSRLVTPAEELEEQVGGVGLERQVAQLVDDEPPYLAVPEARRIRLPPALLRLEFGGSTFYELADLVVHR